MDTTRTRTTATSEVPISSSSQPATCHGKERTEGSRLDVKTSFIKRRGHPPFCST